MPEKTYPEKYKGYLTSDLLQMWEQIQGDGITKGTPEEKIRAMREFLKEFRLGIHGVMFNKKTQPKEKGGIDRPLLLDSNSARQTLTSTLSSEVFQWKRGVSVLTGTFFASDTRNVFIRRPSETGSSSTARAARIVQGQGRKESCQYHPWNLIGASCCGGWFLPTARRR
jgi:hypothetical protein